MPELTRKRVNDHPECWRIHYAGVRVGVIARRSGNPTNTDRWRWDSRARPRGISMSVQWPLIPTGIYRSGFRRRAAQSCI